MDVDAWFNTIPSSSRDGYYVNRQTNLLLLEFTKDDSSLAGNQGEVRDYVIPVIDGAAPAQANAVLIWTSLSGFNSPDFPRLFSYGGGDWAVT